MLFINDALADADTITIQDTDETPTAPEPVQSGWMSVVPMVLIFAVFYFLLIRPQEKKRKEQEQLVDGVKKGEEVLTTSGMFGVVKKINDSDNTVVIEVASGVEVKMLKNSIADIISRQKKDGSKAEHSKASKEDKTAKKDSNKKKTK